METRFFAVDCLLCRVHLPLEDSEATSISFALTAQYGWGTRGGCSPQASPLAPFLPLLALAFPLGGRSFPFRSSASLPLCGLCFGTRVWARDCAEKTVGRSMVDSASKGNLMIIHAKFCRYANRRWNDGDPFTTLQPPRNYFTSNSNDGIPIQEPVGQTSKGSVQ